ncbi:unnamed protein product [Schistosoma curassoni]|uniref:Uncharacterized protein n=1 Tax=Schistosoma curassoni TaxID=6186 RepID=A0A183L445_9TREM|nr:unnamed protein product [Schistosoma curassoni]
MSYETFSIVIFKLLQQLREREMIEKDIRQQHEMSTQLKLQYSIKNLQPNNKSLDIHQSKSNIEEIECSEQGNKVGKLIC